LFLSALTQQVKERCESGVEAPLTRPRHRHALQECTAALARARNADLPELAAEDLRLAVRALGRITGAVDLEELLDVVFRDFCIGK
jgi:tRNA modification GTPase